MVSPGVASQQSHLPTAYSLSQSRDFIHGVPLRCTCPRNALLTLANISPTLPRHDYLAAALTSRLFILSSQPNLAPIRVNRSGTKPPTFRIFRLTSHTLEHNR